MINKSLGQLRVRLGLDDREFRGGLKDSKAQLAVYARTLAVGVAGAGVAAAAGLAVLTRESMQVIDQQAKLASSLDTTTASIQVLERAGELAGVNMAGIEQLSKDLTRRLSQAADSGAGPAAQALDRLGLSAQTLMEMPLDQRISTINAAIEKFIPAAGQAAVAGQLFGEEGSIAASRLDPSVIRTAANELERFGVTISDVDAAKIEAANDAMSRLGLASKGLGTTLAVAVAPGLTVAANALTRLITGQTFVQQAVDQATIAMGDQIRQTAQLNAAINSGVVMTREAAVAQLQEAEARRANIAEQIRQLNATVRQSSEYQSLTTQLNQLMEVYFRGVGELNENPLTATFSAEELEQFRLEMDRIMALQQAMLNPAEELNEAFDQSSENIARIRAAIEAATGNMVSFGGAVVEGITLSDRLVIGLDGAVVSADRIRAAVAGIDFSNPIAGAQALARQLGVSLHQAMQIMGLLGGAAQAGADAVIYDPRDPRFDANAAAEGARLERIRQNMADLQAEAEKAATSVAALSAASGGGGGGGRGAAAAVESLSDELTPAEQAAKNFADTMKNRVVTGLESMVDYIFSDGEKSLKGLVQIFKRTVLDMMAIAAKNRIMLSLGIGGVAGVGPAMASNGLGAISGTGGGLLNSLIGGAGGLLGGLGSGLLGASPVFGTGFMGGLGATISTTLGAGGGLGGLFSVGGNAALAGGGLAATIGAALPLVGIAAGLFGLFRKKRKPIISSEDFKAVQIGLEITGQSLLETGRAGQRTARDLKNAAGGIDEFTSQTSAYFDAFFTDEEKRTKIIEGLTETFDGLNIVMPKTNEQFREIVEGLDLTTGEGQRAYSELMKVAGAFSQVYGSADAAQQMLSSYFGGNIFRSRAEEMLAMGALRRGEDLKIFQGAGGVIRPGDNVTFGSGAIDGSAQERATLEMSMATNLATIARHLARWDAVGVPSAEVV